MFKNIKDKEYIAYLTAFIGATIMFKNSKKPIQQSLYMQSPGRMKTLGANELLNRELQDKYDEDAYWESTLEQRIEVLTPFVPKLDTNKFYATMSRPIHSFRNMYILDPSMSSFKPMFKSVHDPNISRAPLWFATGYEWLEWMASEMKDWLYGQNYIYEITLKDENILRMSTHSELYDFTRRYQGENNYSIQWDELVKKYSGIVISPYIQSARYDLGWYYSWDIASGCVWNWNGIKEIKLLAQRDGTPVAPQIVPFGGDF